MENNIKSIAERLEQLIHSFNGIIYEDIELEILHVIANELLQTCDSNEEEKRALVNMFVVGQTVGIMYEQLKRKKNLKQVLDAVSFPTDVKLPEGVLLPEPPEWNKNH